LHAARRRAERGERQSQVSEARYRRLVDTAGEGIWALNAEHRTTYANPRLGEILGVPPEGLIGQPFREFFAADGDPPWVGTEATSGSVHWHELRLRRRDGTLRYALVAARTIEPGEVPGGILPCPHGAPCGLLLMVIDVTRRTEAEQALREQESVLRSFYESSATAMGVIELLDEDLRFVSSNAPTGTFFGLAPGCLDGMTAKQLGAGPEQIACWLGRFRECQATGRPVRFEQQATWPMIPRWIAGTLSPMVTSESGRALFSFVFEDVTDRKRTEADLRVAKEQAEAASQAKDRFLAVLSHELRTPLTPVLMTVSSLLESNPDPALAPDLDMIRRNIELEARLIDDLLDLSRIVRGRLRLELEVVDIHQAIRRAVEICNDVTLVSGLEVSTELHAPAHHVMADHARVTQVVWNLIRNASKFTAPGGTLVIRTANPGASSGPGESGPPGLVVEFEDTGIGIEPALLPRIFDPFEQGHDDIRGRAGGLGLGLAISRSVAEALGGRLTAASPGRGLGSTFRLELPTVPAPRVAPASRPGAVPAATPSVAADGLPLRIILVEDNQDTLRYLTAILRRLGHDIVPADCLSAARAALSDAESPFDLLLSDIELPDGNGLDLMRELRAAGHTPGIAMSGFGTEEDLALSRDAGFFDHLTKPIDLNRLTTAIHSATAGDEISNDHPTESSPPFRRRSDARHSVEFELVRIPQPESNPR
jgi:PAS domain S-box-containing protein